jgi:hypothetical protein
MIQKPERRVIYKNPVPALEFNAQRYRVGYCQRRRDFVNLWYWPTPNPPSPKANNPFVCAKCGCIVPAANYLGHRMYESPDAYHTLRELLSEGDSPAEKFFHWFERTGDPLERLDILRRDMRGYGQIRQRVAIDAYDLHLTVLTETSYRGYNLVLDERFMADRFVFYRTRDVLIKIQNAYHARLRLLAAPR